MALWEPDEEFEQLWQQVEEESQQRRALPCRGKQSEISIDRIKDPPKPRNNSTTDDVCWRCGEKGHRRESCDRPRILFCSTCKRKGIRSVDCCRKPRRRTSKPYYRVLNQNKQVSRPRRISVSHQATQCEIIASPKPPCVSCGSTGLQAHHAALKME